MNGAPPHRIGSNSFFFQPWVFVSALTLIGAYFSSQPAAASSVAVTWLGLFLIERRGRPRRTTLLLALLGLLLFGCSAWRAHHTLINYKHDYHALRAVFPEPLRCTGQGEVISSPTQKAPIGPESGPSLLFQARFGALECEGQLLAGPLQVRLAAPVVKGQNALSRGDVIEVFAQLAPPQLFRNPGSPDRWPSAARTGAPLSGSVLHLEPLQAGRSFFSWIDRFRAQVRSRIQHTYPEVTAPLGRALVLGESDLPGSDAAAFRQSGLLHLLAVSGTHLVIFVLTLVRVLRAILVRIQTLAERADVTQLSSAFGAVTSLLYADFSGGSGSAWRAAYMLCVVCGGRTLGLRVAGPTALGASLLIGLTVDPLAAFDFSFLLSALATAGLIGLGQPLTRLCTAPRFTQPAAVRLVVESLCATLASSVPCAPVLAMMDDRLTAAALLANVIAAPLGEIVALPACLLHAFVAPWPTVERGLALLGSGALYGVRAVALGSASLSDAQFLVPFPRPSSVALGLCALLLVVTWRRSRRREGTKASWTRRGAAGVALVLVAGAGWSGWAHSAGTRRATGGTLTVTALDVGQGDALLVEFPRGTLALIDGGGYVTGVPDTGTQVVLPYLRSRRFTRLDLMVLSHAHPDHLLGLLSVAQKIPVRTLWIPGDTQDLPARGPLADLVRAVRARGGRVVGSHQLCGPATMIDGTQLEVLAPCTAQTPPFELNDNSLVLRIQHGARSVLLTGDIEQRAEELLLQEHRHQLRADLLKVAHHGSDTSTHPDFVQAVAPSSAFISCGARNRFRHPRPATLDTLLDQQVAVFRTDQQGSLSWSTDGELVSIRTYDPLPSLAPFPTRSGRLPPW